MKGGNWCRWLSCVPSNFCFGFHFVSVFVSRFGLNGLSSSLLFFSLTLFHVLRLQFLLVGNCGLLATTFIRIDNESSRILFWLKSTLCLMRFWHQLKLVAHNIGIRVYIIFEGGNVFDWTWAEKEARERLKIRLLYGLVLSFTMIN